MSFDEVKRVKMSGGPIDFYSSGVTTTAYVATTIDDGIDSLTISNDSNSDSIQFSYDGAILEGELLANESITVNVKGKRVIYIKGTTGSGGYRCWGW